MNRRKIFGFLLLVFVGCTDKQSKINANGKKNISFSDSSKVKSTIEQKQLSLGELELVEVSNELIDSVFIKNNKSIDVLLKSYPCKKVELPFSYDSIYLDKFIRDNQSYCIIELYDSINYYPVINETWICPDSLMLDKSDFNFKRARIKLPNKFSYHAFIVSDSLYFSNEISSDLNKPCASLARNPSAYLVLNDTVRLVTTIISLSHPSPSRMNNPQERSFSISKDFKISLLNYGLSYTEPENNASFILTDTKTLTLNNDGTIKISTQKEY